MRLFCSMVLVSAAGVAQRASPVEFEIASVKVSERPVGPDYNNRIAFSPAGLSAKNATLRRLVSEAYGVQMRQVIGPGWVDRDEYDVEARAGHPAGREELDAMLRVLLAQRFELKQHSETREMRVYELVVDGGGPKIHPVGEGEPMQGGGGLRFHGEMRQFADFLAVPLSIPALNDPSQPAIAGGPMVPVLDKTGLSGIYDFSVEIRPEPGTDMFTAWQRALPERLGLRLEPQGPDRGDRDRRRGQCSKCQLSAVIQISRRPSMAFHIVTSSANSRSLPTGTPMAMRVTPCRGASAASKNRPPSPRLPRSDSSPR